MVIVEGSDGSGKTSLIEKLAEETPLSVAPKLVGSDTRAVDSEEAIIRSVEINMVQGLNKQLYDRHPLISEMIYGPALRQSFRSGFEDYRWLRRQQQRLRRHHPLVIFCLPPFDEVLHNVKESGNQPMLVVGKIEEVYWSYFALAASWQDPMVWDYTGRGGYGISNYWQILDGVMAWLTRHGLTD